MPSVCAGKDRWDFDPVFFGTEKLPINEKNRYFWRAILMVARHAASI
jgi:hypothetical protein